MKFIEKLNRAWSESNSLVCVGLDPDQAKLPECVKKQKYPIFTFNKAIIDATSEDVCCYKPQIACYEGQCAEAELAMTLEYIRAKCPGVPVILDAKRGDIGNTSKMYAKEAFERYQADAVTLNPYMGMDALKPFLDYADKGAVILCRTSNAGAKEIQELELAGGLPLYKHVAALIAGPWNFNGNNMLVWLCLLAATIGIGILSKSDGVVYVTMLGVLLSILSAVVYAFYLTFINKGSLGHMPSVKITFYVMCFGTLLIMMGVGYNGYVICPEGTGWLCSFGSALFPTSLSLIFTALAIQSIGSTQTAILGAFEPVTAVAIGTLIFGEQLSGNSVVGILMILIAVTVVVMQGKIKH